MKYMQAKDKGVQCAADIQRQTAADFFNRSPHCTLCFLLLFSKNPDTYTQQHQVNPTLYLCCLLIYSSFLFRESSAYNIERCSIICSEW